MTAYWIVFVIMFVLQFVKVNTNKEYLWRLIISFVPLFVYAAFRVDFGYDYENYQNIFDLIHKYRGQYDDFRAEIGYLKLNEWLPTFRSLLIVTSAFTCAAYIFIFYMVVPVKYSWLAVLLLFLAGDKSIFFMFSGIRNSISISMLIFTYPLLQKRKLLPFLLCMLLASIFHKTAFIYYPMAYFTCSNKDMERREMLVWGGVFAFFFIFSHTAILGSIGNLMALGFEGRYDTYIEFVGEVGDSRGLLSRVSMIFTFVPLLWFTYKGSFSPQMNTILRLGLVYTIATTLGALNMRTTHHFILFFIVTVIYVYSYSSNNVVKYGYSLFVCAYLAYALFIVYMGNPAFPYDVYESTIFGVIK